MQQQKSAAFGTCRALHRRQLLACKARFEILDGLSAHARHALFARPGSHDAWVRPSNGGADRSPDRRPDIQVGFVIKVLGL